MNEGLNQIISIKSEVNIRVKFTLVQALRLCTGRTTHWESRSIALLFLDHGTRRGWDSATLRPLFTPRKDPVPIVHKAGWAPGPVWTDAENLAPTGIRSPDRPSRSQSLYRLSYPGQKIRGTQMKIDDCFLVSFSYLVSTAFKPLNTYDTTL